VSAQARALADLAAYQEGSVVSRQVMGGRSGNVTLFAFAAGQGLSEHTAPFDALVYVYDGEAEVTIAGQPHAVRAGELIVMPANQPHALKATQPFKMMLVMIRQQA
jgi:quercetin dioxygenase-like cupin family protein